ncbi:beta-mannosidase [Paenibacillus mendelii]|uniref:beta-mannosidase n=1 Tax=Paenibacillus mendelii TaxID=206163 RepID=A0ABV6J702_9BACL|nr:glycoside hydrolase family 2 protein [Paenibacillus mendelii]MCQ6560963.1 beta-mannosidase [Paenibacillus mendelii]
MRMELNLDWRLTGEDLSCGPAKAQIVRVKRADWLTVPSLPCDIHMPLIEHGLIKEPLVADNCFESEWTEKKSWWFAKDFQVTTDVLQRERVTLHIESLDSEADIWLNGIHLGHHRSAFYPFTADVRELLTEGDNDLLIRLTSGLEHVSEQDIVMTEGTLAKMENEAIGKRGDERRANVRKAQFVYGWDWGPRVATCGIAGGVWLDAQSEVRIRSISAVTVSVQPSAFVRFEVEADNAHPFQTREAELIVELLGPDSQVAAKLSKQVCLRSGFNYLDLEANIPDAALWWPNGMGDQPLYTVRASIRASGEIMAYPEFKFGIRTIALNTEPIAAIDGSPAGEQERQFTFEVNGVQVFAKGGNWIPADSVVSRVSDDKYATLVREAREANFNMLRIWGGGIYERDIFYEKCDEYGILIWHDFMFSCGKYPDHLPWFREETAREIDYQTRRLRNHASLALWCGNNENHWGFDEWWNGSRHPRFYGGAVIYNEIAPELIRKNCPHIPYWNSSPYGGQQPNGNASGDRHHWNDGTMSPDMQRRITPEIYDEVQAKFVSEYGYIGPCRLSSIETYFGGAEIDTNSRTWALHTNTFEKDTVLAGIRKHYVERDDLTLDEYLLYAGLCQSLMYAYSLESIRSKTFCSGALFWMYNDCWGEVGWTIIDYYLKRKLSYYGVKRAFAPQKLILREQEGMVEITAMNETDAPIRETLECGFLSFDGSIRKTASVDVVIPARYRGVIHRFAIDAGAEGGLYAAIPVQHPDRLQPAVLRPGDFRTLALPEARVRITEILNDGDDLHVTVSADTFVHAVHFDLPDSVRLSDHYFDLLPGESRTVTIYDWSMEREAGPLDVQFVSPR